MKASTHKNNLKIGRKTIRDGSLQIKSKQKILNKKDLMINGPEEELKKTEKKLRQHLDYKEFNFGII